MHAQNLMLIVNAFGFMLSDENKFKGYYYVLRMMHFVELYIIMVMTPQKMFLQLWII